MRIKAEVAVSNVHLNLKLLLMFTIRTSLPELPGGVLSHRPGPPLTQMTSEPCVTRESCWLCVSLLSSQ